MKNLMCHWISSCVCEELMSAAVKPTGGAVETVIKTETCCCEGGGGGVTGQEPCLRTSD